MADELTHLKTLRTTNQRRLQVLEKQAAQFGINTPPYIQIEIEDLRVEIEKLDNQIAGLEQGDSPPRPALKSKVQRCADLADHIRDTQELLKRYEERRRLEDDPRAIKRAERSIADLREELTDYQAEASRLGCTDR
jgi:chromosome segregation ATPase